MSRGRWIIETRTPETDERRAGDWTRDGLGEEEARTTYPSRAAAERQIKALLRLGGEWAEGEYRARQAGGERGSDTGRTTAEVKLRLAPATRDALDALATRRGLDRSATVAALVMESAGDH